MADNKKPAKLDTGARNSSKERSVRRKASQHARACRKAIKGLLKRNRVIRAQRVQEHMQRVLKNGKL